MLIATWNVNSIRSRLGHLQTWLKDQQPDVLCLQETKVSDPEFPYQPLQDLGYHCTVFGQKAYNGVAILSRHPLTVVSYGFGDPRWDEQKRLLHVRLGGLQIVNVYVPNGGELDSDKYHYKLQWLERLRHYLQKWVGDPLVVCGDFNIAPDDRDYYDPGLAGSLMASAAERQALQALLALPLTDAFRYFTAEPGHYSWWDYRAGRFRRNQGWRIDHVYVSAPVRPYLERCWIDPGPRRLDKPSDHTPVIVDIQAQFLPPNAPEPSQMAPQ